jgi:hypothetical protein
MPSAIRHVVTIGGSFIVEDLMFGYFEGSNPVFVVFVVFVAVVELELEWLLVLVLVVNYYVQGSGGQTVRVVECLTAHFKTDTRTPT